MRSIGRVFLLLLAAASLPARSGREAPRPYDLVFRIGSAADIGQAGLKESLAFCLESELLRRGCFRSAAAVEEAGGESGADLVLDVTLEDVEEETTYDATLAQSVSPDQAGREVRPVALFGLDVRLELRARASGRVVTSQRFRQEIRRSPRVPGEDVAAAARDEGIVEAGRRIAAGVCRISTKRLARETESPAAD